MTTDDASRIAIQFRLGGPFVVTSNAFMPLAKGIEGDLKEYTDDSVCAGQPYPPQAEDGDKGIVTNVIGGDPYFTVVVFVAGSLGAWAMRRLWDALLGKAVNSLLERAALLLKDVVGRPRHPWEVETGQFESDCEGVVLSIAMWSPRDNKYAVIKIEAHEAGSIERTQALMNVAVNDLQAAMNTDSTKPCLMYRIVNGHPPKEILHLDEIPPETSAT